MVITRHAGRDADARCGARHAEPGQAEPRSFRVVRLRPCSRRFVGVRCASWRFVGIRCASCHFARIRVNQFFYLCARSAADRRSGCGFECPTPTSPASGNGSNILEHITNIPTKLNLFRAVSAVSPARRHFMSRPALGILLKFIILLRQASLLRKFPCNASNSISSTARF